VLIPGRFRRSPEAAWRRSQLRYAASSVMFRPLFSARTEAIVPRVVRAFGVPALRRTEIKFKGID
jgi:hypothetical protein